MILKNWHGHRDRGDQGQADGDGRSDESRSKTGQRKEGGKLRQPSAAFSGEDNLILSKEKVNSLHNSSLPFPRSISEIIKVFN